MKFNKKRLRRIRKKGKKVIVKKSAAFGEKSIAVGTRIKEDKRLIKVDKVIRKKTRGSFKNPAKKLGLTKIKQRRNDITLYENFQNNISDTFDDTVNYVKSFF